MHEASYEKMRAVAATYVAPLLAAADRPVRVLDVRSGAPPDALTHRSLFPPPHFAYTGLDIEPGPNVDLVVTDPFHWASLPSESVDVVISGQMLEHDPLFWITLAEMTRVLVPGGLVAAIAPSAGHVHRYPYDCWRFYPDAWPALCSFVGLELLERSRERVSWRTVVPGVTWRDAVMVARKPQLADAGARAAHAARLEAIVATRVALPPPLPGPSLPGPAGTAYERTHTLARSVLVRRPRLGISQGRRRLRRWWKPVRRSVRGRVERLDGRRALARGEAGMGWPPPPGDDTVHAVAADAASGDAASADAAAGAAGGAVSPGGTSPRR